MSLPLPDAFTGALSVTYRLPARTADEAAAFADALLLEQSIETPRSVAARYPFVHERLMGHVESVEPEPSAGGAGAGAAGAWIARLRLPTFTAASDPAQLMNVVFGNASLHAGVDLVGFEVPDAVLERGRYGPGVGADGLRRLAGDPARPLIASALKPAGLTARELADVAYRLALGGCDVIKDDHYLSMQPTAPFAERVVAVVGALDAAAQATGRRTRYAPNVSGAPDVVLAHAEQAVALGADALLVAPFLVGLPAMLALVRFGVPILAHPAFSGTAKAPLDVVTGQIFRLYGADAVIFAGHGGRFSVSVDTCRAVAARALGPMGPVRPALPTPAGGMTRERAAELVAVYGRRAMLLVGGSLLAADDITAATRALVDAAEAATAEIGA